jgi:hypothetical protein
VRLLALTAAGGVRQLLNNNGNHETVISTTSKQTRQLLNVMREQLSR